MERASYVLKFNDGMMMPKNETIAYNLVKKLVFILGFILIFSSIVLGEFLLFEMSFSVWVCTFISVGYLLKNGGRERRKCYVER